MCASGAKGSIFTGGHRSIPTCKLGKAHLLISFCHTLSYSLSLTKACPVLLHDHRRPCQT